MSIVLTIHRDDIITFGIRREIVWLIVEHSQSYLVTTRDYAVEHDEFDSHDRKHVNRYHNSRMLCMWDVHDRRLAMDRNLKMCQEQEEEED